MGAPRRRCGGGRGGGYVRRGRAGWLQRKQRRAVKGWGATRGVLGRQEVAWGQPTAPSSAGQRRWQSSRAGKQAGEEDEDYFAISKSSRG